MKWRTGWLLALTLLPHALRAEQLYGDVNGNGIVEYRDAVILLRVAGGLRADRDSIRRLGDVAPVSNYNTGSFGDGRITLLDVLRVARKAYGLSTAAWPAKMTGFPLESGNSMVFRRYDPTGAVTGPDLDVPDSTLTLNGPVSETVGGTVHQGVYVTRMDGSEQHFLQVMDASNTPTSLQTTQLVFGGNTTTFNPPLVLALYPFTDGATWGGVTSATDVASGVHFAATYNAVIHGPEVLLTADGVRALENAWRVSLSYTTPAPGPSGTEYFWFVPFLGPVQHGYSRTLFGATTTIIPDSRLVSANIHGVLYP